MQMKKHLFEKRIHAKDGRRGETEREREGERVSSRFIYIQADFQLSKIRRNESTAGSARTNVRGEEEGEGAWSGFIFVLACPVAVCRLAFCSSFALRTGSFAPSSAFPPRRRFAFPPLVLTSAGSPTNYFVKKYARNYRAKNQIDSNGFHRVTDLFSVLKKEKKTAKTYNKNVMIRQGK